MISCLGLNPLCAILAAATPSLEISLTDALLLLVVVGLFAATYQLNKLFRRIEALEERLASAPARPAHAVAVPPAAVPVGNALPSELPALIAAAAYVALGRPVRIVSIAEGPESKHVWSLEGRRQIFASHQRR
jgi:hypothetical protein